jgi:hypothetical protein
MRKLEEPPRKSDAAFATVVKLRAAEATTAGELTASACPSAASMSPAVIVADPALILELLTAADTATTLPTSTLPAAATIRVKPPAEPALTERIPPADAAFCAENFVDDPAWLPTWR